MYGLVNKAIQDLVVREFGESTWAEIAAAAGFEEETFLGMEVYDDELTHRLVQAGAEKLGRPPEELLEVFGEFWIKYTALEGYGDLLDLFGETFDDFLANLDWMHARVDLGREYLRPPSFELERGANGEHKLHHRSTRTGLAPMVTGLLGGLAHRFHADVKITHQPAGAGCDHDVFLIRPAG